MLSYYIIDDVLYLQICLSLVWLSARAEPIQSSVDALSCFNHATCHITWSPESFLVCWWWTLFMCPIVLEPEAFFLWTQAWIREVVPLWPYCAQSSIQIPRDVVNDISIRSPWSSMSGIDIKVRKGTTVTWFGFGFVLPSQCFLDHSSSANIPCFAFW